MLKAFINEVDALQRSRRLSEENADQLRDLAQEAIELLENGTA